MPLEVATLPYSYSALAPGISRTALELHHKQVQLQCLEQLNARIAATPLAELSLEQLIQRSQGRTFELAVETWNHQFFWSCLRPHGGGEPEGALAEAIQRDFGGSAGLRAAVSQQASNLPGSGWVWLVQRPDRRLAVVATPGAGTPLTGRDKPLLAIDLWEHAYWQDHQAAREAWLEVFWSLVNWDFAAKQLR